MPLRQAASIPMITGKDGLDNNYTFSYLKHRQSNDCQGNIDSNPRRCREGLGENNPTVTGDVGFS